MFNKKRKVCGMDVIAEAATSTKQQKIYHAITSVDEESVGETAVSIRNVLICTCKLLNQLDETHKYSKILTNILVRDGGVSPSLLSKGKKRALSVKSYVYDGVAMLLIKNTNFKKVLFETLKEVEKKNMYLCGVLSVLKEPMLNLINQSGDNILEILQVGSKQQQKNATTMKQKIQKNEIIAVDHVFKKVAATTAIHLPMPMIKLPIKKKWNKNVFGREDLSKELALKISSQWKMINSSSSTATNFQQFLKHLNVPWLIRKSFISTISNFTIALDHAQNISFSRIIGHTKKLSFSLSCNGPMYQASIPCISRTFSWACDISISKAKYTFEGVQNNALRFTCNLPKLKKRLMIIAKIVADNVMETTWQVHNVTNEGGCTLLCSVNANYVKA
jgi:hypothetical protein